MKPKNQKRKEAIVRMQQQIDGHYNNIRHINSVVNPSSDEAKKMVAFEEDKINKLQKTIRFTELALQPSYRSEHVNLVL